MYVCCNNLKWLTNQILLFVRPNIKCNVLEILYVYIKIVYPIRCVGWRFQQILKVLWGMLSHGNWLLYVVLFVIIHHSRMLVMVGFTIYIIHQDIHHNSIVFGSIKGEVSQIQKVVSPGSRCELIG